MTKPATLINTPASEPCATVILAHGAGAAMDSAFMEAISGLLCESGCEVIRFEFPYMAERRKTGSRRPPDRQPRLLEAWRAQLDEVIRTLPQGRKLFIGGKSLGGRMASLIADESAINGLICLGYPFHPAGKPAQLRTEHLAQLKTPTLIVQGTRDRLGDHDEVATYTLSAAIKIHWLADGDHDLKPRVKSGFTHTQHIQAAVEGVMVFIRRFQGAPEN